MDYFQSLLHDLHMHADNANNSQLTIQKISKYLTQMHSTSTTDVLIFLIFGSNGITSFMKKVVTSNDCKYNILSCFELIEFILVNFEKQCLSYVDEVMRLCFSIAQRNVLAKIREEAVKLLNHILAPSFLSSISLSYVISMICELMGSNPPSSVLHQIFTLAGIILEVAPEVTQNCKEEMLCFFIEKMKEVKRKTTSISLMSGCLDGINGYLVHFSPDSSKISFIYKEVKSYFQENASRRRLVTDRSALKIIIRHYRIFAKFISEDINFWLNGLGFWLKKSGENRRLGYRALVSAYRAVACMCDQSDSHAQKIRLNSITEKLLDCKFDMSVMIGLVELVSTGFVEENLTRRALKLIMEHSEGKNVVYLSTNLECLSKYLTTCKTTQEPIVGDYFAFVEKTAISLIENYPSFESYFQQSALQALEMSFYYMCMCGYSELSEYTNEVIYQGLMRSCLHQIYEDVELQKDITGKEMRSHKSYLPIWLYLINLSSSGTELDGFDGKSRVTLKIVEKFVLAFLKINEKLDLSIRVKSPYITDIEISGEANRSNDFKIFINNVNLFVDVLDGVEDAFVMRKWLKRLFTEMIDASNKAPFISGFYKVITACLKVAQKVDSFEDCTEILRRFMRDVSFRVTRYKGDLQISCFLMLLAAPAELIEPLIKDIVSVFRVIVRIGSGHFPLLQECLTALEKWHRDLPKDSMENLLRNILPYFDIFLQSKSKILNYDQGQFKTKSLKIRGEIQKLSVNETESQLLVLQRNFLIFLGKINYDLSRHLIEPVGDEEEDDDYNYGKGLIYAIPLTDTKLRIKLEELLPRVIELSLSSSDRRTRITSCEFLHSVVLLTLGNMKQMNGELNDLFRKLVSTCLSLACDPDHVVLQIFEPLMTQVTHYFSYRDRDVTETQIFIDCLMKSASHPHNSSLRDLAARLVREFAEWSLKRRELKPLDNLEVILQTMYSLSVHPDHNKRCGAAIVFNNLYPIIREETNLIDTNWFLFYYHFTECLSLSSLYDDTTPIINAIDFIKESLTERHFNTLPSLPHGFDSNMNCVMEWIFNRCSHKNEKIRSISMRMVEFISKSSSVKDFITTYIKNVHTIRPDTSNWATFFHYYGWLLDHNSVSEVNIFNQMNDWKLNTFLNEHTDFKELADTSFVIRMLEFITKCIKHDIKWPKLKILSIIRCCMFKPSLYGLEVDKRLNSILDDLIPMLSLDEEEMKILLDVDFSVFSQLRNRIRSKESLREQMETLNGLKMIVNLNLWNLWKCCDTIKGDDLLNIVFESLFEDRFRRCYALAIDPRDKMFMKDLVKFSIKIYVSPDVLWSLITNSQPVVEEETLQGNKKGDYFTEFFKSELTEYFIDSYETSLLIIKNSHPTKVLETVYWALKHINASNYSVSDVEKFISGIYKKWCHLEYAARTNTTSLLVIIMAICKLNPNCLIEKNNASSWFYEFIDDNNLSEDFGIIIKLLPYISKTEEESNEYLVNLLHKLAKTLNFKNSDDPKLNLFYNALLKSFGRSKSLPIFRQLVRFLSHHSNLFNENEIDNIFTETSHQHLTKISVFLYQQLFVVENRRVYQSFLVRLLRNSDPAIAVEFLQDNLEDLMQYVKHETVDSRICAMEIVQICIARFTAEELENLAKETKENLRSLTLLCVRTLSGSGDDRSFNCACFNTICTIIATKSNDPMQYRSLIFKEDFPHLSRLVDKQRVWDLRMDFDELPRKRKMFANLRRSITKERQTQMGQSIHSVEYLQEETLFDSSLREDLNKFELSDANVKRTEFGEEFEVELEMDDLNSHESMPTIISVIEHIISNKIGVDDEGIIPFWLNSLMKRLKSFNTTENEKIFILKLICNLDVHLKPYADEIVPDLLNVLLDVFQEKQINYLVCDVITLVLSWKSNYTGIDSTVTRLVLYIIKNYGSVRNDIVSSILELVKLIVETFRCNLQDYLLSSTAFEALKDNKKNVNVDLKFCGILLANQIPAWIDGMEEEFIQKILKFWKGRAGKIAAGVTGAALQYLTDQNHSSTLKLVEIVWKKIKDSLTDKTETGLVLLYGVHKSYPKISSYFVKLLQHYVWSVRGEYKVQCLEMLLSHANREESLGDDEFMSIFYTFLADILDRDHVEVVSVILEIILIAAKKNYSIKIYPVLEKAFTLKDSKNSQVRRLLYEIAEDVYEKLEGEELLAQCKAVLLQGINDVESELSEKCVKFWCEKTKSSTSMEQFSQVLLDTYSPDVENGYLSFAAKLMLHSPSKSQDYIFEYPLSQDCTFRKRNILKTMQHSTAVPMFAKTLSSLLNQPTVLQSLSSSPGQTILHSLVYGEPMDEGGDALVKKTTKTNKRFLKNFDGTQTDYAKRHMRKKEIELKQNRETKRKLDNYVDVFKEYSDGDIPDIRISHSDFLKPLEALTARDPQIARYFLTSLYDAFTKEMSESTEKFLYTNISHLIQQVMDLGSSDPTVVAFFFHVLLHCNGCLEVDSEFITHLAKSSGLLSVGGLVIEEMIIREEGEEEFTHRRIITPEQKRWLNLAELCRHLKEFDVLRGIIIDKMNTVEDGAEAMHAESVSDWFKAADCYHSVLDQRDDALKKEYVDAYLTCLARLSDWSKINSYIHANYNLQELWSDSVLFESVLPWMMKSEMILSLQSGDTHKFLELTDKEPELKKYFPEEFSVIHFINDNIQWVNYFLHDISFNFLSKWSHWSKWYNSLRSIKLLQLQFLAEMQQSLETLAGSSDHDACFHYWSNNRPKPTDDLMNWDVRLNFRSYFLATMKKKRKEWDVDKAFRSMVLTEFELIKSGIAQRNITLSRIYLDRIKTKELVDSDMKLLYKYYESSLEILEGEMIKDSNIRLEKLVSACCLIEKHLADLMDDDENRDVFYETYMKLNKVLELLMSDVNIPVENIHQAEIKLGNKLEEKQLEYLDNAMNNSTSDEERSSVYVELINFYRRQNRKKEMAMSMLRAMKLGSTDARHLFCCLLSEPEMVENWIKDDEVKNLIDSVPTWMFLKWTNQILANLDSQMFPFAKELLFRLAKEYPNAIRFSFPLSKRNYKYIHEYGPVCEEFVIHLESLLSETSHDNFLTALCYVAPPALTLQYEVQRIRTEIKTPTPNWQYINGVLTDLQRLLTNNLFRGQAFDSLLVAKPLLEDISILKNDPSAWEKNITAVLKSLTRNANPTNLKHYSPYLLSLQNTTIEIPGQYTGDQKPLRNYHVTISSFKYNVLVMNSKCQPIRVTILGNDGRDYKFLIKFGEDLRQDQRIQQIFRDMNHVLRMNQDTCSFCIDTYRVIPLKNNLGMIEWVNNTASLFEMITNDDNVRDIIESVQQEHLEFLAQDKTVNKVVAAHLNGYMKIGRDMAVARFRERVSRFEWDLLRKAFWRLSSCPEQFVCLRRNFAVSQAVIYVAHWLLGIGDRHLDNTLVSSKSGRALGIDFGYAFGFATEFLTPPELMPFRLTPQIVNLLKPLGESGLVKESMVRCLRAFRRNHTVILATLEVFAKEPALDWLDKARRKLHIKEAEMKVWSPERKLGMVQDKLNGANPLNVFIEDLICGHTDSECFEKYEEVLLGVNSPAFMQPLSEEDQVRCLINLATDYHVLSKTYVGWNPWL